MKSVACVKLVPRDRLCRDLYPSSHLFFVVCRRLRNTFSTLLLLFLLKYRSLKRPTLTCFLPSFFSGHQNSATRVDFLLIAKPILSWHLVVLGTFPNFFPFLILCLSLSLARTIHEKNRQISSSKKTIIQVMVFCVCLCFIKRGLYR